MSIEAKDEAMTSNYETVRDVPPEIRGAFCKLVDLCKERNLPEDLIYDGVAWNVEGLIKARINELLFKL